MYIAVNCGENVTKPEGSIVALDSDGDGLYDNSQYCLWDFNQSTDKLIHINILNFTVQPQNQSCPLDHLEVS